MNQARTSPLYLTRFVAAYLVLIFHYSTFARYKYTSIRHFADAVNYFFFISGFVMIVSSKSCIQFGTGLINFSKKDFWIKRIARIYPMYILALLLFVIYNYTIKEIDPSIPKRVWLEIFGVQRWVYAGSINFPDWTVSCEFFFYFLFPFALPWIVKLPFKKVALIIISYYAMCLVFTVLYKYQMPQLLKMNGSKVFEALVNTIYLHPVFKFSVFLFGCLCGRFYLTSPYMTTVKKYSTPMFLISLLLVVIFYKYNVVDNYIYEAGILCILYFPFVLSICSLNDSWLRFFSWQPFIFLGEISYGIYIMQTPVEHFFESMFNGGQSFTTSTHFFSYTLFLIVICSLLYYVYEIPAKKFIIKQFVQKKTGNIGNPVVKPAS